MYRKPLRSISWITVIYTTVMFGLALAYWWGAIEYILDMFINDRNYPGGPLGYAEIAQTTELLVDNITFIIIEALGDGLLLFRCYMVWDRSKVIMILPLLAYISAVVCGILTVVSAAALNFVLPYFGLTMGLNMFLSLMICGKLLWARRSIVSALGKEHARLYTSVASMVIESASINAIVSCICIGMLPSSASGLDIALGTQVNVMVICPMLILIRVARGRAYSTEAISTTHASTHIGFRHGSSHQMHPRPPKFSATGASDTVGHESKSFEVTKEFESYSQHEV